MVEIGPKRTNQTLQTNEIIKRQMLSLRLAVLAKAFISNLLAWVDDLPL